MNVKHVRDIPPARKIAECTRKPWLFEKFVHAFKSIWRITFFSYVKRKKYCLSHFANPIKFYPRIVPGVIFTLYVTVSIFLLHRLFTLHSAIAFHCKYIQNMKLNFAIFNNLKLYFSLFSFSFSSVFAVEVLIV